MSSFCTSESIFLRVRLALSKSVLTRSVRVTGFGLSSAASSSVGSKTISPDVKAMTPFWRTASALASRGCAAWSMTSTRRLPPCSGSKYAVSSCATSDDGGMKIRTSDRRLQPLDQGQRGRPRGGRLEVGEVPPLLLLARHVVDGEHQRQAERGDQPVERPYLGRAAVAITTGELSIA